MAKQMFWFAVVCVCVWPQSYVSGSSALSALSEWPLEMVKLLLQLVLGSFQYHIFAGKNNACTTGPQWAACHLVFMGFF